MIRYENRVDQLKIAYMGGGSRGWAWGLMSDLSQAEDISGSVFLYDIDKDASRDNEIIGNMSGDSFKYIATETIAEALTGADFVVISIMPGTMDEMESDVHAPESLGIFQSVGDTTGPGGLMRALRTIPMYIEIANAIKEFCPNAWVINYTNPMAACVSTLYAVFPKIKAFGCCHEVFGTQKLLCNTLEEMEGIKDLTRYDIETNVVGINHFTWMNRAFYKSLDIMPVYSKYIEKNTINRADADVENSKTNHFGSKNQVKFDLFRKFGAIAAAGDRHLAEFCPSGWYLKDEATANSWSFGLTPVSWRKGDSLKRREKGRQLVSGEIQFECKPTGEEGVNQIRSLLGLCKIVTNVNMPNIGQIPNVPLGTVVETNATFSCDSVVPQMAGDVPHNIMPLMSPSIHNQSNIVKAGLSKDSYLAFNAFVCDNLTHGSNMDDLKNLFNKMIKNNEKYMQGWKKI